MITLMIKATNIDFRYPRSDFRLQIGELQVEQGARTAIIGPSGFGKTTLLNLLAGIILPDKGEIRIGDQVPGQLSEKERRNFRIRNIGFVFQDFRLIPYLNTLDNILLPFRINQVLSLNEEKTGSARTLAASLGLEKRIKSYPARLSHGERQRVAICRALVNKPPLILADEPTGNLDPGNKQRIMDILFRYVEDHRATLVTVTHDMQLMDGFSQQVDFAEFQSPER